MIEEKVACKRETESENIEEEIGSTKICFDPEAIRKLKTDINLIERGLLRKEDIRKAKEMRELREEIDNMKTLCIVSEISAGNLVNHIIKSIEEKSSEMGVVPEVKTKREAY
ncbi:MAG: hypothetical protein A2W22_02475 [Candidatus Levybacteria bacterium RBG_16_35_11]|nr:MAG: hypothetical protein A2W22_02475 [Candidatus Levybacteria bacterium RBG_16_35_11]